MKSTITKIILSCFPNVKDYFYDQLRAKDEEIASLKEAIGEVYALNNRINTLKEANTELAHDIENKDDEINNLKQQIKDSKRGDDYVSDTFNDNSVDIETVAGDAVEVISFINLLRSDDELTLSECLDTISRKMKDYVESFGVEILEEASGTFDPSWQRAIDYIHTDDENLEDCVASVVRTGYLINGKCITPQDVVVYSTNV